MTQYFVFIWYIVIIVGDMCIRSSMDHSILFVLFQARPTSLSLIFIFYTFDNFSNSL